VIEPGPWESPVYGYDKGWKIAKCPEGTSQNITGIVLHGGEDENAQTNALHAFCSRPDFGEVTNAFPKNEVGAPGGCGKTSFFNFIEIFKSIGGIFGDFFTGDFKFTSLGIDPKDGQLYQEYIDNTIEPGFAEKSWSPYLLMSPTGITGWEVIPGGKDAGCPKSGICGLNLISAEGKETGWAGGEGNKLTDPVNHKKQKQVGTCPPGKIISEIRTTCGDRVDGIQFVCDVPRK